MNNTEEKMSKREEAFYDNFDAVINVFKTKLVEKYLKSHPNDIDDLKQELCLELYRLVEKYDNLSLITLYIYFFAIDYVNKSRKNDIFITNDFTKKNRIYDIDKALKNIDYKLDVDRVLRKFSKKFSKKGSDISLDIFMLHYFNGITYDEIAKMHSISYDACETRGLRVCDKFRSYIQKEMFET